MFTLTQDISEEPLRDVGPAVRAALRGSVLEEGIQRGERIAITAGSRGIDRAAEVYGSLGEALKERGVRPFLVPAMGSHGGATAKGQVGVLERLGVTTGSTGMELLSSMNTECLGETAGGARVFLDGYAAGADGIIVVNRIAPHTAYNGDIQSGLVKMMVAGLGKQEGALSLHRFGLDSVEVMKEMADLVLSEARVILGLALVEDAVGNLSGVQAISPGEIPGEEARILRDVISRQPRIPAEEVDVLVVDEMGKDINGIGMDPLVTGRGKEFGPGEDPGIDIGSVAVLGLSPGSGGNATGIGHADIITSRMLSQVDWEQTEANVGTSGVTERIGVPVVAEDAREAVTMALEMTGVEAASARIARIRNTKSLRSMEVSAALADDIVDYPGISIDPEGFEPAFEGQE